MNILLVNPETDPAGAMGWWPPIGLLSIATALRAAGHSVALAEHGHNYTTVEEFARFVADRQPTMIGLSVLTRNVRHVRRLIEEAKRVTPGVAVVVGGPHPCTCPESVLVELPEADYAIAGEGEIPMTALAGGAPLVQIGGLIWRENGTINRNPAFFAADINVYDVPAWDLVNPGDYPLIFRDGAKYLPVLTSRGCPYRCSFCAANSTSGPKWRRRSLDLVFKELSLLRECGINHFTLHDEGFGSSKPLMMEFCLQVKTRGFSDCFFASGAGMRLDQIDEELLGALKEIRFATYIPFGIESGSERILKLMRKQTNLALIREKICLVDRMGFKPCAFVILGYPTETREEIEATIRLTLDLPFREAAYSLFMPLPGTEATRLLLESGELPQDFDFTVFGGGNIAYSPRGISLEELQRIRRQAILRFYWRPRIFLPMVRGWRAAWFLVVRTFHVFARNNVRRTK